MFLRGDLRLRPDYFANFPVKRDAPQTARPLPLTLEVAAVRLRLTFHAAEQSIRKHQMEKS
jgi:hypothetical protein